MYPSARTGKRERLGQGMGVGGEGQRVWGRWTNMGVFMMLWVWPWAGREGWDQGDQGHRLIWNLTPVLGRRLWSSKRTLLGLHDSPEPGLSRCYLKKNHIFIEDSSKKSFTKRLLFSKHSFFYKETSTFNTCSLIHRCMLGGCALGEPHRPGVRPRSILLCGIVMGPLLADL